MKNIQHIFGQIMQLQSDLMFVENLQKEIKTKFKKDINKQIKKLDADLKRYTKRKK